MHVRNASVAAVLLLGIAAPAFAQGTARRGAAARADTVKVVIPDVELRFDREIFLYPAANRRDPFTPLAGVDIEGGARFENLELQGVVFSSVAGRSVATLKDRKGERTYRVRRGDVVGNARVLSISPQTVLFAVENFGIVRQETLALKKREPGGRQG